jgi:hypothetical protein
LAGSIGAGGNYSPLPGFPANGERLSDQGRIKQFLHRAEESIEVNVDDLSHGSIKMIIAVQFENMILMFKLPEGKSGILHHVILTEPNISEIPG